MHGLKIERKKKLRIIRWLLLLVVLALLAQYSFYVVRWYKTGEPSPLPIPIAAADSSIDETKVTRKQLEAHKVAKTEPRILTIGDITLKARIQKAGLDERRMFTMPKNLDDVTWYDQSAEPGKGFGAVIIAGRNEGVSRNGFFSHLKKLQLQDIIKIERGDGKVIKYEVRTRDESPLTTVNKTGMAQMMTSLDKSREGLSLITDSGKWIPSQKEFDGRIIVRAVRIDT